jgi:hypothetical protein
VPREALLRKLGNGADAVNNLQNAQPLPKNVDGIPGASQLRIE